MSANLKHRKLNRLTGYDYSRDGYYFVTVCVKERENLLGEIRDGRMILDQWGRIVLNCWHDLPRHYPNLGLDEFIVMPNHVHGIVIINNDVGNGFKPFPTKIHGLSEFIRAFKTFSSRNINKIITGHERFQWQKSFHDYIIRDDRDLARAREYIAGNPVKWDEDINNKIFSI